MALTLDATVGGTAANTYQTRAEAVTLAGEVWPVADAFLTAAPEDQDRALVAAAKLLQQMRYRGDRTAEDQALVWPRSGVVLHLDTTTEYGTATIPVPVKEAQMLLATHLLTQQALGVDGLGGDAAGVSSVNLGGLSVSFDAAASASPTATYLTRVLRPLLGHLLRGGTQPRMVRG